MTEPFRVLFVCMGNICRSPAGEGVLKNLVTEGGLQDRVFVDSAGTIGYHVGEPADYRMSQSARKRGISLTSLSRKFMRSDLDDFDLILAMDKDNYREIRRMVSNDRQLEKVKMFCHYCQIHPDDEVPDPYYGGARGFEHVLDLLEDGCIQILEEIKKTLKPS